MYSLESFYINKNEIRSKLELNYKCTPRLSDKICELILIFWHCMCYYLFVKVIFMKRIILIGILLFVFQSCGLYSSNGIYRQTDSIKNTIVVSCKQRYFIKNNSEIFYANNDFVLEKKKESDTFSCFFNLFTSQDFGKIDSVVYVKINDRIYSKTIKNYSKSIHTETKTDTESIKDNEDKKVEIVTGFQSDSRLMHQFELNYNEEELLEFKNIKTLSFQFYKNRKPILINVNTSEILKIRNIFSQY
jgi:hypothetical protein